MQLIPPIHSQTFAIPRRPLFFLPGIAAALVVSGCAFLQPRADPTRFYVLTVPAAASAGVTDGDAGLLKVGLRLVEVPAYLRTRFMVVRTGANEIHFADFDRWAEPLDQGIGRVMKETLGSARNVESVALNTCGDESLDYEVAVRILACEGTRVENGRSSICFAAAWEVRTVGTNSTAVKRGGFTAGAADWDGKDYGQLAARLGAAIAGAGKALAADLVLDPVLNSTNNHYAPRR
jgi:uncharacterized lipoprotein YmbA